MADQLPIVDFGPFISPHASAQERMKVALEVDKACREVGFFYLKNHGVSTASMNNILTAAREFFETATVEEKESIAIKGSESGGDSARGWLRVSNPRKGSHEVRTIHIWCQVCLKWPS
jgi:isopenicillin N synthase-like dioxygenase